MIVKIDESKHNVKEIRDLLKANGIEGIVFDNVYFAICQEEISQAIDCSDSLKEDKSFYDKVGNRADDIIYDLTDELYNAKEINDSFQELAETAQLIVNRKLYSLEEK